MTRVVVVNASRCLACKSCVIECARAHISGAGLPEALFSDKPPQARVHVERVGDGAAPVQCQHCDEAPCIMICPKQAMHRPSADGPVLVDLDRCIGCRFCMIVCPFGAIDLSRAGKTVIKCDQCLQRTQAGEPPACVAACPTGAMEWVEADEQLRRRRRDEQARQLAESHSAHAAAVAEDVKTVACEICGAAVAPRKQLERIRAKLPKDAVVPNICPRCRRSRAAAVIALAGEPAAVRQPGND